MYLGGEGGFSLKNINIATNTTAVTINSKSIKLKTSVLLDLLSTNIGGIITPKIGLTVIDKANTILIRPL